jgi:selenocysteine lyase/cysteine desulfurase
VVERLAKENVIVRELPARELVRASVGWWTSDGDLDRLAAAVAG